MDVTSLLNSNPAAAEQRKRADSSSSKAPSRNRTPWDAGGYSLPINTAAHGVKALQQQQEQDQPEKRHNDIRISTPPSSPKHRFSDSRSSLSSFASSLQSTTTHSRYSSTSTLNSNFHAHHKSHGTDILSPELRSISQALEESASLPLAIDSYQANESRQNTSLSPTGSPLEQLALVAECHSSEMRSESSRRSHNDAMETGTNLAPQSGVKSTFLNRPGSPSDAILIKRTSIPSLRVNTGDLSGHLQQINYLSAPLDRYGPSFVQNKTHKRTLSEPYFRPTTTSSLVFDTSIRPSNTFSAPSYQHHLNSSDGYACNMDKPSDVSDGGADTSPSPPKLNGREVPSAPIIYMDTLSSANRDVNNPILGPHPEPTPPSSQHPDDASPTSPSGYAAPHTPPTLAPLANTQAVVPPTLAPADNTQTIVCMYVLDCDTGSQPRKAISHIFGRNKMCTRLIPSHVWVHYCRKHYQRARYRNPKEYAKLQCDLVQQQLARIHDWSEDNRRNNRRSGIVLDWTLAVRKREQKRFEDKERRQSNKRKRSDIDADEEDDDEDNEDIGHEPATAVPAWLRPKCRGQRYTTHEICEIFNQLHREILNETGSASFPDLEILPNISVDTDAPKSPKGYAKRPSGTPVHRRAQSMGVVPSSQHSIWEHEPSMHGPPMHEPSMQDSPNQKKRRPNSHGIDNYTERELPPHHLSRPRMPRPGEGRRLPSRHMYPHPEEYHGYGGPQHGDYHPQTPTGFQVPLPAPTPQRTVHYSPASHFEQHGELRGPQHGRSQSDVGFMNGQPGYMQQQPSYYNHDPRGLASSHYQGMGYPREQGYSPSAARPHMSDPRASHSHMSDMRPPHPYAPGHGRHQSTPLMPPSYGSPSPGYQQPTQSYAPPRRSPLPPTPRIAEDEKSQQLFRDRR